MKKCKVDEIKEKTGFTCIKIECTDLHRNMKSEFQSFCLSEVFCF